MRRQQAKLDFVVARRPRRYHAALSLSINRKGTLDLDTVKGCTFGMRAHPDGGCYGECYAHKIASRYGIDFRTSVVRDFVDHIQHRDLIIAQLLSSQAHWYRIGVMGDPCHDWQRTLRVVRAVRPAGKTAVIITKHWVPLSDDQLSQLRDLDAVVHTSISALDTEAELAYRLAQARRIEVAGVKGLYRIVTCRFGDSDWARQRERTQRDLLALAPAIDTPLRVGTDNAHVACGDILTVSRPDCVGGGKRVSLANPDAFLGTCAECPDQCGVPRRDKERDRMNASLPLFQLEQATQGAAETPADDSFEYRYVPAVTGSGFEQDVAKLALEDGIAHRAARKNMQKHSAIILLHRGEFAGFFTFQNNTEHGEFCLLQSVIRPDLYRPDIYEMMVAELLKHNAEGLPALITTNPKSTFETPEVFEKFGFSTYLKMSGFHYMCAGDPTYYRLKTLAHISMTNVWDSTKGEWLRLKKEWNEHIDEAGRRENIPNPAFATREGCWQGESGFANVVTGRSHNGNASVLDPVACEVVLRFFTPREGRRIYNPFGGGVQFGFVAGASGYQYTASEIRQNQCDANNALCRDFPGVIWVQSDSSQYEPDGMYDLIFSCPPYYRVETYRDYEGVIPDGEINARPSYAAFRDALFSGYERALAHLNDNRFFVVMTGDSRDTRGAYHCHEAETELFMRDHGLSVYNKIIYLEAEFTRLAQAKKTLHTRKFPKREQKIIVGYKGRIDKIAEEFASIGRL